MTISEEYFIGINIEARIRCHIISLMFSKPWYRKALPSMLCSGKAVQSDA